MMLTPAMAFVGASGASVRGATPSAGDDCDRCEAAHDACRRRSADCASIGGSWDGRPKSKICRDVVACVRRTRCASESATDSPSDCFCGRDADIQACTARALDALTGECRDIIAAGAESTNTLEIGTRFGDPSYALGLAMRVIQCDQRYCARECAY